MTQTPPRRRRLQKGSTLNYSGRVRLLLDGRLQPPTWPRGRWYGSALDWHHNVAFRVRSDRWLPIGTVLVCDHRQDVDAWLVNVEQTMAENALSEAWLRQHEPGGDGGVFQITLLP
jgi:hypothetical protein